MEKAPSGEPTPEQWNIAEEMGACVYEPRFRELLADLAQIEGDADARERELRAALRGYTEMSATGHAERVARALSG